MEIDDRLQGIEEGDDDVSPLPYVSSQSIK